MNSKIEALDFDVETAAEEELFVNNEVGCHTAKLSGHHRSTKPDRTAPLRATKTDHSWASFKAGGGEDIEDIFALDVIINDD